MSECSTQSMCCFALSCHTIYPEGFGPLYLRVPITRFSDHDVGSPILWR